MESICFTFNFSEQVRFESVNRVFEPLDDGLETSGVTSSCAPGTVARAEICGTSSL